MQGQEQSCPGKHAPAYPNLFFCACKREAGSEEELLAALGEERGGEGALDVHAEGVKKVMYGRRLIRTPLLWAAERNWSRLAATLLDKGAGVNS